MKKFLKIISLFLCFLFVFLWTDMVASFDLIQEHSGTVLMDKKIPSNVSIDQDFADNRVLVVLDKSISTLNKVHGNELFESVEIKSLSDLTSPNNYQIHNSELLKALEENKELETSSIPLLNEENYRQIILLELPVKSKNNVLRVIKQLEKIQGIVYAGPDYITESATIPNDSMYDSLWAMDVIKASDAWDITTGSSEILVGVIDSGIANHPDLNDNVTMGWDFYNENSITSDDGSGHGTHVAGTIGAIGCNEIGVPGVSWSVSLVPLQVTYEFEVGYALASDEIEAVMYAVYNNIPIINYSRGGGSNDPVFKQAIANYHGIFVCSAGNIQTDIDQTAYYPGKYNLPNMITVANTKQDDTLSSTSNYGATTVHLAAPGTGIYSCYLNNGYIALNGTSMAAPHVAGVAALIMSLRPDLSPTEIKELILNNVDKVDALSGKCVTGGRLNAYKAVRAATESQTMTGDVNGDGRTDMILSRNLNGNRALTVFMGKTDGSFTEPVTTNSIRLFIYSDPAFAGDFNGDGFTDVIIHWRNGPENKRQFLVYTSKGDGTFNDAIKISCVLSYEPDTRPCKFFVDDVNGDGKDDFIVITRNINNYYTGYVYKGTAQSPYLVDTTVSAMSSTYVYSNADTLHCGDFNGDGRADIVLQRKTSNGMRELDIFLGNVYGNLISGTSLLSGRVHDLATYPSQFFVSDVDGNGKDDFVVHWRNSYGRRANLVYLGKETSPYITDSTTNALDSMNSYVYTDPVFTGDINGDGRDDMVVHWATGGKRQLLVYFAKADGTYNLGYNYAMANASDPSRYDDMYFVEDVNGDGKEDFVVKWKSSAGYVCFLTYLGTANSGFTAAVRTEPTTHIPYYS